MTKRMYREDAKHPGNYTDDHMHAMYAEYRSELWSMTEIIECMVDSGRNPDDPNRLPIGDPRQMAAIRAMRALQAAEIALVEFFEARGITSDPDNPHPAYEQRRKYERACGELYDRYVDWS